MEAKTSSTLALSAEQQLLLKSNNDSFRAAAKWIQDADYILLCGAAGMSVGTGLNYSSREDFAEKYPAMLQYGYKTGYECMGLPREQPAELAWGYLAAHINNMRYKDKPHEGYTNLLDIITKGKKNYFILTSNVDMCYARAGFDKDRMYTPQGDFGYLQCFKPCNRKVVDSWPIISKILPEINSKTQKIDSKLIPRCSNCGTMMFANVRGGAFYIHDHFHAQNRKFVEWVKATKGKGKLVCLEIGAGFNTPTVTRFPMESIARWHDQAAFVRINMDHSEVPSDLPRAVGIESTGRPAIAVLKHLFETQPTADGIKSEKTLLEQRAKDRKAAESSGVIEQWQLIKQRWGHFDWENFMNSLARNDEDDGGEEEQGEEEEEAEDDDAGGVEQHHGHSHAGGHGHSHGGGHSHSHGGDHGHSHSGGGHSHSHHDESDEEDSEVVEGVPAVVAGVAKTSIASKK